MKEKIKRIRKEKTVRKMRNIRRINIKIMEKIEEDIIIINMKMKKRIMEDIPRKIKNITETIEAEVIVERNLAKMMIKVEGNLKMIRNTLIIILKILLKEHLRKKEKHTKERILCLLIPFHLSHHLNHLHLHALDLEAARITKIMIN